jgi:hypothetical protein
VTRGRSLAALSVPVLLVAVWGAACMPGVRVLVHNDTREPVEVAEVQNDGSARMHVLAPGRSQTYGPAVTWHVISSAGRFELVHPGEEFAARGFRLGEHYRFQVEEGGCVLALPPDAPLPAESRPLQPPGYPLGPPACRDLP